MENFDKNNDTIMNINQILVDNESFDLNNNENHESILKEDSVENISTERTSNIEENAVTNIEENVDTNSLNTNNELEKVDTESASTTNCLALTIKEEHKLVAIKNVCLHSLKVTWKVIASTIALHILKIFF